MNIEQGIIAIEIKQTKPTKPSKLPKPSSQQHYQ